MLLRNPFRLLGENFIFCDEKPVLIPLVFIRCITDCLGLFGLFFFFSETRETFWPGREKLQLFFMIAFIVHLLIDYHEFPSRLGEIVITEDLSLRIPSRCQLAPLGLLSPDMH